MHTKLLILDLDETLVFASEEKLARTEDFQVAPYFVYKRPGVERFIEFAFTHFEVAVWTSSSSNYAKELIDQIFQQPDRLQFVWARERCTRKSDPESGTSYWIKDLKKVRRLGRSLEGVLVVDDSPGKLERSYGNHIHIRPFEGDPRDDDLRKLQAYLLWLKDVPNVRLLDKRDWRTTLVA
ncbi:MAG: HAD family hydrolase [Acidobacteriia bacterium]|nr:HAD family hydrolase [Terriglobia bacterium]